MVTQAQARPRTDPSAGPWPPDDTEESVLGIDLHQETITNLRLGINGAAWLSRAPEQPVPWKAETQLLFLGCKHLDGSAYRTLPDVFVFPRPIDPMRGSFSLKVDGPPLLIIEILSESTYEADLDLEHGKGYSYARAGVAEYLTLDPTGELLDEGIRAWRLEEGVYRPWEADGQGRWQSDQLPVAVALEGMWATVYTREGRRMLREGQVEEELDRERSLRAHEQERREQEQERREQEQQLREQEQERRERAEAEVERLRRLLEERNPA